MTPAFEEKLWILMRKGHLAQTIELCRALDEITWLADNIAITSEVVDHARALLDGICEDAAAADRTERLWICDILEPRLEELCAPDHLREARRLLGLARQIACGDVPAQHPAPQTTLRGLSPAMLTYVKRFSHHSVEQLVWLAASDAPDGARSARSIRNLLTPPSPAEEAARQRSAASSAAKAARIGALGPHARALRQAASSAAEQAAFADVRAQAARYSTRSRAVIAPNFLKLRRDAEKTAQAKILSEHCRPHLERWMR